MRLLVLAPLLLAPALAIADDAEKPVSRTPDARQMHTDDCAKARKANKPCVIDMGKAEEINGNNVTATGIGVGIRGFAEHASLIRIRKDFIVEILKSAEDL